MSWREEIRKGRIDVEKTEELFKEQMEWSRKTRLSKAISRKLMRIYLKWDKMPEKEKKDIIFREALGVRYG